VIRKETPMRSLVRLVLAATVIATGPLVAACSSTQLDSFDPSAWFDTKKKLTGERRDLFPDGVPGVTSGVPADLVKGYRDPEGGPLDPAKAAAEAAAGAKPAAPQRTAQQQSKPKPAKPKTAEPTASVTPAANQQPPPPPASTAWPAPQQATPWPGSR